MKYFLKSMFISLLIGIPLTAILMVFLYSNQKDTASDMITADTTENITVDNTTSEIPHQEEVLHDIYFEESEPLQDVEHETNDSPTGTVTLSFAGDVHFSELRIEEYNKSGIFSLADDEMLDFMKNADLFMLNHEFVFSNRGEAMEDKEYTLRNDPKYVTILNELGIDTVSIANNHILDFGQDAFLDTLNTLSEAGIDYVGGGKNIEEAVKPATYEINGQTFAIFAATRVSPSYDWYAGKNSPGVFQTYDAEKLNNVISDAEKDYDHTIVFVHWGIERNELPEEYQRSLAKGYIDAGADLVIGCHPHILQGFEYYKGVPIIYSLGNYLFGNRTGETVLLNAVFSPQGELQVQLIPCERVGGVLSRIQEPNQLFDHLKDISFNVTISETGILVP